MKILIIALLFVAGASCATQKDAPASAPDEFEETEPAPPPVDEPKTPPMGDSLQEGEDGEADEVGSATCQTPECEEQCANAGPRLAACVAAFEAGCMSADPPSAAEYNCRWDAAPKEEVNTADESSPSESNRVGRDGRAKEKKKDDPGVNLEKVND